ncbi:hypothetical protein C0Q70_21645 [Pomacea canaliculata]|uniref:Endonuclease/exonuclease/phosphatase domain-containing protein n=1 Tax=Pomacea canaliculata TaxID=400727 RepID=A0A2T7ND40_POMCA|nr:hypothetical protein C0Q70_21645 [Pomacea canaliculata]
MDEAEYIEVKVPESGFLIAGDFNSQSQSWGYILDKREDIETWQDENHLILVNDPTDPPTLYLRRWHTTTKPDLALCTDDIHKNLSRTVLDQLGGSNHRPVLLTITGSTTPEPLQHARWNH